MACETKYLKELPKLVNKRCQIMIEDCDNKIVKSIITSRNGDLVAFIRKNIFNMERAVSRAISLRFILLRLFAKL